MCCVIKMDRKIKYIYIFVSLCLAVFLLCLFPFEVVEWYVFILPMGFCVQLESRQPKVYVKTNQY